MLFYLKSSKQDFIYACTVYKKKGVSFCPILDLFFLFKIFWFLVWACFFWSAEYCEWANPSINFRSIWTEAKIETWRISYLTPMRQLLQIHQQHLFSFITKSTQCKISMEHPSTSVFPDPVGMMEMTSKPFKSACVQKTCQYKDCNLQNQNKAVSAGTCILWHFYNTWKSASWKGRFRSSRTLVKALSEASENAWVIWITTRKLLVTNLRVLQLEILQDKCWWFQGRHGSKNLAVFFHHIV